MRSGFTISLPVFELAKSTLSVFLLAFSILLSFILVEFLAGTEGTVFLVLLFVFVPKGLGECLTPVLVSSFLIYWFKRF